MYPFSKSSSRSWLNTVLCFSIYLLLTPILFVLSVWLFTLNDHNAISKWGVFFAGGIAIAALFFFAIVPIFEDSEKLEVPSFSPNIAALSLMVGFFSFEVMRLSAIFVLANLAH